MSQPLANGRGIYLFGFVRARDAERLLGAGWKSEGEALAIIAQASGSGLAAVVERVPIEEFGPDVLQKNLDDVVWLGRQVRHHHEVLEALARLGSVAPVKLGTVFLDETRLRRLIEENEEELVGFLDEVDGKDEWGVRVYVNDQVLASQASASSPKLIALKAQIEAAAPGEAYLLGKRRETLLEDEVRELAAALAGTIADEVSTIVDAMTEAPIRDVALAPGAPDDRARERQAGSPILHLAVLLDRRAKARFLERMAAIGSEHEATGLVIELSGPWPPYSFCPAVRSVEPTAAEPHP